MIKKGFVIGIVIVFLVGSFASGITINLKDSVQQSSRGTLYVGGNGPGNYTTIQSAINDANPGDTVFVYNGTYYENVIVNKDYLNLTGEDKYNTIIDGGSGSGQGISIPEYCDYNVVSGFTVTNTTYTGIWIHSEPAHSNAHSDYNTISDCIVRDCTGVGGIRIIGRRWTCHADYNTVINCEVYNISGVGLLIHAGEGYSYNNQIINTKSYNNTVGIYVGSSQTDGSIISNCTIFNNTEYGLKIESSDTTVYHNNLLNNVQNTFDSGTNTWYNASLQEGNYYDDYNGTDNDGDGIGDTPYPIPGGSNLDNYPLMYPWYPSHPDTVYVDDDYNISTPGFGYDNFNIIQYGINEVPENGTVYVYNGTYYENVVVNKTVNLIGEDSATTIIDGSGVIDVVYISADWANVNNFTIRNSGGIPSAGIWLISNHNFISNNRIIDCLDDGIRLDDSSSSNIITENIIRNTSDGIGIEHSSNNNTISNNTISNSTHAVSEDYGLYLGHDCENNIVIGNNLIELDWGIYVEDNSNNNKIYHNNLFDNSQNAYDDGTNTWDNGYPSGGNYWDDYTGTDSDGDGIGDTPYNISGSYNQDLYPLMNPLGENPPIANFTHSGNESPVLFDGSLSYDRDGIIVNWTWGFGDGTTGYGILINHSYSATGIYNVMLTVTDDDGYIDNIIQIIEIEEINQPPGIPFINGPKFGKPRTVYSYTLISVDPEDEDVFYEIDWGDGSTEPWDGPYESNTLVNKAHEWGERGIYIIRARAKDDHGTIGEWGTLIVTMPRNHVLNTPFLNFLQNHPNISKNIGKLKEDDENIVLFLHSSNFLPQYGQIRASVGISRSQLGHLL